MKLAEYLQKEGWSVSRVVREITIRYGACPSRQTIANVVANGSASLETAILIVEVTNGEVDYTDLVNNPRYVTPKGGGEPTKEEGQIVEVEFQSTKTEEVIDKLLESL